MNRALRDAVSEDKLGRIDRTHHRHERSCGTDTHILGGCHGIVVMVKPMKNNNCVTHGNGWTSMTWYKQWLKISLN